MSSFSIVYITYRPGGIDILADSLVNQTNQDYELIIVDDYIIDRKEEIKTYLKEKNIKVKYVGKSKPKLKEYPFTVANAINTGFILSTKEIVVLIGDYIWFEPNFLEKIDNNRERMFNKTCIVMPSIDYETNPPETNGNITIWNNLWKGSPLKNGCRSPGKGIPGGWEFACIAFEWNTLAEINGYPEYMDGTTEHSISLLIEWMERYGAKPYVDTNNFVHTINHRNWLPGEIWHYAKNTKGATAFITPKSNRFNLKTIKRGVAFWKK